MTYNKNYFNPVFDENVNGKKNVGNLVKFFEVEQNVAPAPAAVDPLANFKIEDVAYYYTPEVTIEQDTVELGEGYGVEEVQVEGNTSTSTFEDLYAAQEAFLSQFGLNVENDNDFNAIVTDFRLEEEAAATKFDADYAIGDIAPENVELFTQLTGELGMSYADALAIING